MWALSQTNHWLVLPIAAAQNLACVTTPVCTVCFPSATQQQPVLGLSAPALGSHHLLVQGKRDQHQHLLHNLLPP